MTRKRINVPVKFFIIIFTALAVLVVVQNLVRQKVVLLEVADNAGVSLLETIGTSLVSVFQDGRVVSWDWGAQPQKTTDFRAASDQAVILDARHLAAVNETGKKMLAVYDLLSGKKQKDLSVGWEDQDIRLRISPDKKTLALIRVNNPDEQSKVLYEWLTIDLEKEIFNSPTTLSIASDTEDFVDYAVSDNTVLYALGSQKNVGRIAAVDLEKGTIQWNMTFENTKEFCSVAVMPDSNFLYAGNRDGFLYKLDIKTGQIVKKIQLLKKGETRPVTNDYSVLNLAFSPDAQFLVATITPKTYILMSDSDTIIHFFSPADRLVSKIAFSPDNQFIATSDIRAGYPVKIWKMPAEQ